MRPILEYLLSKDRKNAYEFPKDPYLYDIVEFLKAEEFEEIEDDPDFSMLELKKIIGDNMKKANVFCVSEDEHEGTFIRIGGKGKLSKENPIFACMVFYPDYDVYYPDGEAEAWVEYPGERIPFTADTCTYETLKDEMKKRFGWK